MFCKLSLKLCKSWGRSSVVSLKLSMYSHKDKLCWLLLANYGRRQWHPTPILLPGKSHGRRSLEDYSPWVAKSQTRLSNFTFTFHFHALEKEMATHSSVLSWRIPGTGEPGGLPSMGSHRVGHDWSDLAAAAAAAPELGKKKCCHLVEISCNYKLPTSAYWHLQFTRPMGFLMAAALRVLLQVLQK